MKINSLLIVILIAISLIFISGQQGCNQNEEVSAGTLALTMNFIADAPPSQVNYGQKFPIYVDIKNEGGYDIDIARANFYLTGIGENLKDVQSTLSNSVKLTKKTTTADGGSERLKFADAADPGVQLNNPFSFNMQLDSCYDYAGLTETSICIGESDSVCKIEGEKITGTSNTAGPIQVSSLTERIEGNKQYITFTISNKGTGKVYLPTSDCDKLQESDLNENLKADMIEIAIRTETGFTCQLLGAAEPYATANALEGAARIGTVTCVKTLDSQTHSSSFEIVLSYKYRESKVLPLTILPA